MQMSGIPFGTTDWSQVEPSEHKGERGLAYWRTCNFGTIRVRMVEYTAGYVADHWCVKGHILLCTEGELHTELDDGRTFTLKPGMSYQVADNAEAHRSYTERGAKLSVVELPADRKGFRQTLFGGLQISLRAFNQPEGMKRGCFTSEPISRSRRPFDSLRTRCYSKRHSF